MADSAEYEFELNGESFTARRQNTTLYTFWGRVVLRKFQLQAYNFNHVYLETDEDGDHSYGAFVFKNNPMYQKLADFAIEHSFPQVLNQIGVPASDVRAWENTQFEDLNDTDGVPDEWL